MKVQVQRTVQFDIEEIKLYDLDFDVRTYNAMVFYLMQRLGKSEAKQVSDLSGLIILTVTAEDFAKTKNVGKKSVECFENVKEELIKWIKNGEVCLVKIAKNNTF